MTTQSLESRITTLERVARRDRVVAICLLGFMLATAQTGRTTAPVSVKGTSGSATLTAGGLVVRDRANVRRVLAGFDKGGTPAFDLSDKSGVLRSSAYTTDTQPELRQYDASGNMRDQIYLGSDNQQPEYRIVDANQTERLSVFIGSKGLPEFDIDGSDGKVRAYISTDDTMPYLVMKDNGGNTRLAVGAYTTGAIGMDIRDTAGTALWQKP